jgi:cytochrome c oxidase subunit 4
MILAVITGVEIVIVYIPIARWIILTALVVLSVVKFLMVIFYFMHLKWDKLFCTILFFIGLVLGGGTAVALLLLFAVGDSHPLDGGVPPF